MDAEPKLRELKSRAQLLKPVIRLGKAGATAEFLAAFNELLDRNELIKMKFDDFKDQRVPLSRQIAQDTGSTVVQQVGHTAVFYRKKPSPSE